MTSDPAPPPASILLVDDYPANLLALEAVLQPLGHTLVRATSGEAALKAVLRQEFAVIIMDVQMPGLDGFQTAALLKTRERSRHIPIIFLTAISKDAAQVFQGYAQGAVDYLLKPFDPQILRSKVSVFVELWQRGELLRQREAALRALERERLAQEAELRYRALVEAMPASIIALDAAGRIYYSNARWRAYAGLADEEPRRPREPAWHVVHPEDRADAQAVLARVCAGDGPCTKELRLRRAQDGEHRWHTVALVPQHDAAGTLTGFIGTATDIHDQHMARLEVERASRAKDEFLATISHELRNPLNAILGWTRMLRSGKLDADRAARALETVERNAEVQAALIEDMLDVSRIITGKLLIHVGAVDLERVVSAAFETVRMAAEAKEIDVRLALDQGATLASGDAERLQQVVWNLLSNAIKFTPRGGAVEVRTRRDGSQLELAVRDTGQGIAPEFLPFVFDRFRQADSSSTRVHGGLGLGLAIVRHLVELHGGTVRVWSEGPGQGATFTVRLPVRAVAGAVEAEHRASRAPSGVRALGQGAELGGLQVLVIDDEADARELLAAVLEHHGAAVQTAGSVDEALPLVERLRPDVLVSDIGMPGADGYDLIRRVRALPPGRGGLTPAAAVTGFARSEDGRRALAAGFDRHVAKPVEPVVLVDTVQALAALRPRPAANGERAALG